MKHTTRTSNMSPARMTNPSQAIPPAAAAGSSQRWFASARRALLLSGAVLSAALVQVGSASAEPAVPNAEQEYVIVLLDNGAAMLDKVTATHNKWTVARWRIKQFLALRHRSRQVALWTFSGTTITPVTTFQTPAATVAAVDALAAPVLTNTSAPLAAALCDAVAELDRVAAGTSASKRVFIQHSAAEDTSASSAQCAGTSSAANYPAYEAGSWQAKVRNTLRTGVPTNAANQAFRVLLDSDFYVTRPESTADSEIVQRMLLGAGNESGGSTVVVDFNQTAAVLPRFGDNNQDGCVNSLDTAELLIWSSEELPSIHALTRRLDVNRDGKLDNGDPQSSIVAPIAGCTGP